MVRITLYEDNHSLRETLIGFFSGFPNYAIVGNYINGSNAVENTLELKPDIAIVDIDMPETNGIECSRRIKMTRPETLILIHTVFEDDENLFAALCAGANGYILKSAAPEQLISAIEELLHGGAPMSPSIARKVITAFSQTKQQTTDFQLSKRELEILELLVKGYSYKMIASECNITKETVKTHLKNIYAKLQVNCGTEAVAKALKHQIIP